MQADRPPVVLGEYEETDIELTLTQAQTLRRLCGGRLTVQPGDGTGCWRIKVSSCVGAIVTPDVRILIRPKVPIANLYYLLEASGRPITVGDEIFEYERTSELIPSFATFFAKHLDAVRAKGVPRSYVELEQPVMGVRGRVAVSAQRRHTGLALPLECRFDEYTADNLLNRILRAATVRLLRLPGVAVATRGRLRRHASGLEEVADLHPADLQTPVAFTRLTEHCRPAERLARIVLENSSLLDTVGTVGAAVFLVDMNTVFEDFVGSRLVRYLSGHLRVHRQPTDRLDVNGDVSIRPDFLFDTLAGRRAYVADCKYKLSTDGFGRAVDYYQLNAYAAALNLREGLLIYCQDDGKTLPREVQVRHGGPRLRTWSVRLDGDPSEIEAELGRLAKEITVRAATTPTSGRAERT